MRKLRPLSVPATHARHLIKGAFSASLSLHDVECQLLEAIGPTADSFPGFAV